MIKHNRPRFAYKGRRVLNIAAAPPCTIRAEFARLQRRNRELEQFARDVHCIAFGLSVRRATFESLLRLFLTLRGLLRSVQP